MACHSARAVHFSRKLKFTGTATMNSFEFADRLPQTRTSPLPSTALAFSDVAHEQADAAETHSLLIGQMPSTDTGARASH